MTLGGFGAHCTDGVSGGGHDKSLRVIGIYGVLVIVMIASFAMYPQESDGWQIFSTEGSGTQDDPYSGTVTSSYPAPGELPSEIWVFVGTTADMDLIDLIPEGTFDVDSGYGVSIQHSNKPSRIYLGGIFDTVGDCVLSFTPYSGYGLDPWTMTIHIVSTTPDLVFESNPSDGTVKYVRT